MDAYLIKLWAEDEIHRATNPYRERCPSIFSNNTVPCLKNINHAIEYLNSLSKDELEFRISMWHWEDRALGKYDELIIACSELLSRSIDTKEWARLEIDNIVQLLEKGADNLMTPCDYFHTPSEIPDLYKKLLTGNWTNFLFFEELRSSLYSKFRKQNTWLLKLKWNDQLTRQDKEKLLIAMRDNWEYLPMSERIRRTKALPIMWFDDTESKDELRQRLMDAFSILEDNINEEKLYSRNEALPDDDEVLYNKNWHLAKDIQALIWYKNYLLEVLKNGADFSEENEYISDDESIETSTPKINVVKELHRVNDGYTAIVTSYQLYQSSHGRIPRADELMCYMLEYPPAGFFITGKRKGNKIDELSIEGVDKPIDRAAFRKRFERYFKKSGQ